MYAGAPMPVWLLYDTCTVHGNVPAVSNQAILHRTIDYALDTLEAMPFTVYYANDNDVP